MISFNASKNSSTNNEINFGSESSPIQTNCPVVLAEENYSGVG